MTMSIDWDTLYSEAGETSGPLAPADYDFLVQSAEHRMSSTGKNMYVIKAVVESGPSKNKAVWHNFVVSPDSQPAMEMFFGAMRVFGLDKDFWRGRPSNERICDALKGRRFRGSVTTETWQGVDRNKIKSFKPVAGSVPGMVSSAPPPPPPPPAPAAPSAQPEINVATQGATPPPPPPPMGGAWG